MKNIYYILNYSIMKLIRVLVFLILIVPFLYFNKFNQDQIDYIIHGNKIVDSEIIIGKIPILISDKKLEFLCHFFFY